MIINVNKENNNKLRPNFKLFNAKIITITEVIEQYKKENQLTNETIENNRTLYLFSVADNFFGGWISGELPNKQIQNIILPHHKHTSMELVSRKGATLKKTVNKLKQILEDYKSQNDVCIKIIQSFQTKDITTIYLSLSPLKDLTNFEVNSFKEYKQLRKNENVLIHLDGLHKLLWLGLNNFKGSLKVIIACKKTSTFFKNLEIISV